ncbi:MAG: Hsp20/alpha crystallin family protein, partial [Deltaproteobacteria bacterium]
DFNRLFEATRPYATAEFPAVNVWTSDEDVTITAELPGMSQEDLDISVTGDTFTIRGTRKPEEVAEGDLFHRSERWNGSFTRSIQLPFHVDADKAEARFNRGILSVTLPRREADKPKKITVKSA